MKKLVWLTTLILTFVMVLGACDPQPVATEAPAPTAAPAATEAPPPAEPFRVAVVMPSAINDLAFSQSMYDALVRVQEEMGAENFEFVYSEGMFVVDDAALLEEARIAFIVADLNMSVLEGSIGALPRRVLVESGRLGQARNVLTEAGIGHVIADDEKA